MKLLLLGPPASGKGTIGRLTSVYLSLPLLNVGKLLREIREDSIWYQPIHKAMDKGELVSNSILGGFLSEVTKDSRYENGYVMDGWVRQLSDLDYFDPKPDYVIFMEVSEKTSEERVLSRRVCEEGNHTYNLVSDPPEKENVCDIDGSSLVVREDDNSDVLKHRWEIYRRNTLKVVRHYRELGLLVEVSAEESPQNIFENVKKKLNI